MTISQIQYFLAVARELSFSKAAESLFVSQPAVSRQVLLLEQELDAELFQRTNQGITLTDAGAAYEQFFRDAQRQFLSIRERVRGGGVSGTVNLGCAEAWDLSEFYPALSRLLGEKYPKLTLNLTGLNHDRLFPALCHGEVDVVITMESLLRGHKEIASTLLTQRDGLLLYSARHPLAGRENLTLADFREEPFYVTAPPAMKEAPLDILALCAGEGFVPAIEYVPTLSAAYLKLQSGRGVLFSNDWIMAKNNPIFACLPLPLKRRISLAWLAEGASPHTQLLVEEILLFFQEKEKI